jgi:hypothetical protein
MSSDLKDSLIPEHYAALFARRVLNFTDESIKEHFDQEPPYEGQTLILSMQQHNMNRYRLVKVINPASGRQRRIIINHSESFGGASYYRSGKSCYMPKSQTKLLPFVKSVAQRLSFDRDTVLSDDALKELLYSNVTAN